MLYDARSGACIPLPNMGSCSPSICAACGAVRSNVCASRHAAGHATTARHVLPYGHPGQKGFQASVSPSPLGATEAPEKRADALHPDTAVMAEIAVAVLAHQPGGDP